MSFLDSLTAFGLVLGCELITAIVILTTVKRQELACIIRRITPRK